MQIVDLKLLPASATVEQALRQASEGYVLVAHNPRRTKVYSAKALRRARDSHGKQASLESLPRWSGTAITLVPRATPVQILEDLHAGSYTPRAEAYVRKLKRPLVFLRRANGIAALISGSEEFLSVTYHCEKNNHPYYPPPAWWEGKRCWCSSPIVRED